MERWYRFILGAVKAPEGESFQGQDLICFAFVMALVLCGEWVEVGQRKNQEGGCGLLGR